MKILRKNQTFLGITNDEVFDELISILDMPNESLNRNLQNRKKREQRLKKNPEYPRTVDNYTGYTHNGNTRGR